MAKESLASMLEGVEFCVNTVPGDAFARRLGKALRGSASIQVAFDASYGRSPLGGRMLLEQAMLSFRCWTGKPAPRAAMRRAMAG
jgi:hypothetical protein